MEDEKIINPSHEDYEEALKEVRKIRTNLEKLRDKTEGEKIAVETLIECDIHVCVFDSPKGRIGSGYSFPIRLSKEGRKEYKDVMQCCLVWFRIENCEYYDLAFVPETTEEEKKKICELFELPHGKPDSPFLEH